MVENSRICPDSVPTASRFSRMRSDRDPADLNAIGTHSARNGNGKCLNIMPVPQDTIPTTQDIVTMLIRYSRICYDRVTIVIRQDKIGWGSRMLRDAPNCRECLADLSRPFPILTTLLRMSRLRPDINTRMIGPSRSLRIVIRLFYFLCSSTVGAIIGTVWPPHHLDHRFEPHKTAILQGNMAR